MRLKQGRESLKDDPHSGCPLSVGTKDEFTAMENLIDDGIHYTIDVISQILSYKFPTCDCHFKRLRLCEISMGWVPHILSQDVKDKHVKISSELLQICDGCDDR